MDLFRNQVLKSWPECSTIIQVEDSSQVPQNLLPTPNENLRLIVPILFALNMSSVSFAYSFKLCSPCSVVFIEVSHILHTHVTTDTEENGFYWPVMRFPGSPFRTYHFFFLTDMTNSVNESELYKFAKSTHKIHPKLFAILAKESLKIYILSLAADRLILSQTFPNANDHNSFPDKPVRTSSRLNYEGAPIVVNICTTCGKGIEYFRKTGTWNSLFEGVVYELLLLVNGTLEEQRIMTLPHVGTHKDGRWDDWLQPLIDGNAAISTVQRHTIPGSRVVMYTRPVYFDYACFITEKPKRVVKSQALKLISPLSPNVWIGSGISLFVLFIFIEFSIRTHRYMERQQYFRQLLFKCRTVNKEMMDSMLSPHFCFLTLGALLKPLLEQGGMTESFSENVRNDHQTKLLIGLWLILLIVLISGYKSAMTSVLVLPAYTTPPSTFKELAYSDYKIWAVFWTDNLELDFQLLNNQVGKRLIERAVEYNYFDDEVSAILTLIYVGKIVSFGCYIHGLLFLPQCYVKILEGEHACIGFYAPFQFLGTRHLVDAQGRLKYVVSKESMFHKSTVFAVSTFFQPLYRKF